MSRTATGVMKWEPWKPRPFAAQEEAMMLFHGQVVNHYSGDLTATSTQECLILGHRDGTSPFYGLERVVGELEGRTGSFVLEVKGVVRPGTAEATMTVVPGSGTAQLAGLEGEGTYKSDNVGPDGHSSFVLNYVLPTD
ncbi:MULTISPECIES: DUF3224 domain-containing protein [Streptomyces]|uniref:DUF3224 domain-containing protein n=1 Tax=Streptomyces fimbriatus TaxID=68197 RepID=A0ABW0D5B0_STRFI|nr:DUF3224 domain-containing protein [Streptomyces sp.]